MISLVRCHSPASPPRRGRAHRHSTTTKRIERQAGFSLVEFTIACAVLLAVSGAVFALLARTQEDAGRQGDVQAVVDDTRHAMDTLCRYIRQAANDPQSTGLVGVEIRGSAEVRLKSDLTGSAGASDPDKGDPDGDTADAGEDVTIRHNAVARTIELRSGGGTAQTLVNNITALSMEYFDAEGQATGIDANVRRVRISLTGTSPVRDPRTRNPFSLALTCDVQILARQ